MNVNSSLNYACFEILLIQVLNTRLMDIYTETIFSRDELLCMILYIDDSVQ